MKSFQNTKIAKLAAIGAAISLFSGAVGYAAGEWENIWVQFDSVNLKVNGQNVTSSNLLYNDRTYVPLRACAEMLGSTVEWSQTSNTASITANTAGSADTAKVISDMQSAGYLLESLYKLKSLELDLYICYTDCVKYSNNITADFSNKDAIHEADINFFNEAINDYNQAVNDIPNILSKADSIGLDYSETYDILDYYNSCIANIKLAYEKLYLYDDTKNKNYQDEAEIFTDKAFDDMSSGGDIRKELLNKASNYIKNYK